MKHAFPGRPRARFAFALAAIVAITSITAASLTVDVPPSSAEQGAMIQPVSGTVTSIVGGCGGDRPSHTGVDIAGNGGSQISASYDGVVTTRVVNYGTSGYGNYVVVTHSNGYSTLYAHMRDAPSVELNQRVSRGQRLGWVGSTGNSTGSHLHFELRRDTASLTNDAYTCKQSVTAGAAIPLPFDGLAAGTPTPTAASSDRSYSLRVDGVLEGKETARSAVTAVQLNVRAAAADADTIATVLWDGSVRVKMGQFTSGNWVTLAQDAADIAVDGERFVVLHRNGDVTAKDGLFSTDWLLLERNSVAVAASGGRVGALSNTGLFRVKAGGLDSDWTVQEDGATDIALHKDRIGVITRGTAKAKTGSLNASWTSLSSGQQIALSDDRVAVSGFDGLFVKEGGLDARWSRVEEPVSDVALSGQRIAVVRSDTARVKQGYLGSPWSDYFSSSTRVYLG